ncbi:unnamed protein product [Heligmosomoides polygyrus]|uniref:Uncharacterized protein n=1 Tax=Heligmosomoides polygyrus TaxID=6339 RepID=A0A183G918_HELPZ|nr:unnamed protein product [Heligmosomoides polygyrus]
MTADEDESSSIKVNGIDLPRTSVFKYLGSAIASDGGLLVADNSHVSAAWSKWRFLTGALFDKKIPEQLKLKIYRAVVRPAPIYGAECWPVTKEIERRLSVMETKILRDYRSCAFGTSAPFSKDLESPRWFRSLCKR